MPSPQSYNAIIAITLDSLELTIGIQASAEQLTSIDFLPPGIRTKAANNQTARDAADQLHHYFYHRHFDFDLPLAMQGTAFQRRVWQALLSIKPGETCSYGEIAARLGSSARAVGNACRANPIPIVVPCHRIVARQGPGGYCGHTGGTQLQVKQWLLAHERE